MTKLIKGTLGSMNSKLTSVDPNDIVHFAVDNDKFYVLVKGDPVATSAAEAIDPNPKLIAENKILKDQLADAHNAEADAKKECSEALDRCKILTVANTKLEAQLTDERDKYSKEIDKLKKSIEKLKAAI